MEENKDLQEVEEQKGDSPEVPAYEEDLRYDSKAQWFKGGLLGIFIGLAIIVPGVSGSAVAIIFKLYEKLLYAIGNILKRFKVCFLFLLPVLLGAVIGFLLGFFAIQQLLDLLPFATVALFAGMMLGAYPAVTDQIKEEKHTPFRIVLGLLGIAIPIAISAVSIAINEGSASLEDLSWYHYIIFVLLGFVVAITQLLPGLSATALLMAVGYFTPLMESVHLSYWKSNPMVLLVYLCLVIGFLIGLVSVSKLLSYLISKFRGAVFHLVVGLSLGSFISMFYNPEIMATYAGFEAPKMWIDIGVGIGLFIIGVGIAYFFVCYERKHQPIKKE